MTVNWYKSIWYCTLLMTVSLITACSGNDDTKSELEELESFYTSHQVALKKMYSGQPITVIGHKNQDPDAVCSSIALAALLQQLDIDATSYLQGKPIQGVKYVLDYVGYKAPEVKTVIGPGMPLILTDHNDYLQSIDGVENANIVGIVDHHAISNSVSSAGPLYCNFMAVGSTNTIVNTIYQDCGIVPSQDIARIMVAGIIADTDSLTKSSTTKADTLALTQLVKIAQIENLSELFQGILKANQSYEGMTEEEIFMSDAKLYEIAGIRLIVANLMASQETPSESLCALARKVMPEILVKKEIQMVFANISDFTAQTSHIPYYGDGAKETAEAAFGKTTHDQCIKLDKVLTRKSEFVPAITKVLIEGK